MKTSEKILTLLFYILFGGGLLAILIIYRNHYDLGNNPFDYYGIILDCYAVFEIYNNVGLYIVILYYDCSKYKKEEIIRKYYTYSKLKVIEKLNDYFEDIKDIHGKLNDKFPNLKNHSSSYYKYLKATFDEVESKIKELELNISNKTNNNIINTNGIIKNDVNENNTTNYDDTANKTKVQNDYNYLNNLNNNDTPYTPSEETIKDEANKNNDKEKSKKEERKNRDIPTSIRKYKKAVRRIIKLRLLYQEFKIKENIEIEEAKKDKNKNEENNNDNKDDKTKEKNGSCLRDFFDLLGYIAFIMVIATDFLLPIFMKYQNESGEKGDNKENSSILYLILSLFGILILGILFIPYTIISLIY